ncbi:unnamed protein product [Trichobilharzia regenti]|nr:unnamed protein product [Trichobilharzia regenti]
MTHSGGSVCPESLGGKGIGAVGVAADTAATADVLQDDEDEEDEILNEMDVDDADDMKNAMYNLVGEPTLSRHQHSRSHFARRHRSAHLVSDLDDDIMSDDDPVDRVHTVPPTVRPGIISHRYQETHSRRLQKIGDNKYTSHHTRRSFGNRNHRHHDPDSII